MQDHVSNTLHRQRRTLLASGAALIAADALGQGRPGQAPPPDARVLEIAGPWELGGLAPAQSGYLYLRLQVAETLLNASADGLPTPGLAQAWQVSADGLAWRFRLRPGARFHDGSAVTADALLPSLDAARRAPALLSHAPIRHIEAEDALTLCLHLHQPHAALPSLLAHGSTAILAPACFSADGLRVHQVLGSGPYRITTLAPPQRLEAAWFPGHGRPRPAVQALRYLAVGRAETRALMAAAGQADLVFALDPASMAKLRRQPGRSRLASVTLPRVMMLKLNAGHAWLQDVRVRQALSLAIDRPGIAQALLREPELAATQLFPPRLPAWHDPTLAPLGQDLTLARRLLAQAGWRLQPGGWQDAAGRPVRLTLRTFPDRPELPLVATALQEQWRQLGIPVRVSIGNSGDIPLGHRDGSLQIGLMARNFATTPDPTATLAQDFGPRGADWGAMGWADPAVAQALATLVRGGQPPEAARALRRQVLQRLQQDLPVVPVAWYRLHVAVGPRLGAVALDPLERSYGVATLAWASPAPHPDGPAPRAIAPNPPAA